jgi:hypothetical protein
MGGVLVYVLVAVPNGPFNGIGVPSQYDGIRGCRFGYFRRVLRPKEEEVVPFLKWPTHHDIVTHLNAYYSELSAEIASIPYCRDFGHHGAPDWWPAMAPGNLATFATWGWYELLIPKKGTTVRVEGPAGGPVAFQATEKVLTWPEPPVDDERPPPPSVVITMAGA